MPGVNKQVSTSLLDTDALVYEGLLLPTFVPAPVICDAPLEAVLPLMTIAPIGWPVTQPGRAVGE